MLVRQIAAYGLPGSEEGTPRELLGEPMSTGAWQVLISELKRQRLTGLLSRAIQDGAVVVSDDQAAEIHDLHVGVLCSDLVREQELVQLVSLLSRHGIDHRALKGAGVAHLDYPDPSLRSFGDVDLLVRAEQWDDAVMLLTSEGWSRQFREPRSGFERRFVKGTVLTRFASSSELDLHRTLALGPFGLTIRLDELWSDYEVLWLAGEEIHVLGRETRFLHACFHAALGDFPPRLVPLRDVAQMLAAATLDLDRVVELARSWRAEAVLVSAVRMAQTTLSVTLPAAVTATVSSLRPPRRELRALDSYLSPTRSYVRLCLQATRVIPGPADKVRYLVALGFPDRDFVEGRYSSRPVRWRLAARALRGGLP